MAVRCEEVRSWLERVADGEAELGAEARTMEEHLASCEGCREHRRFLAAVRTAGRAPLPLPPESYWERLPSRVLARIGERRAGAGERRASLLRWQWVGALAAALLVIVLGFQVLRLEMEPAPAPERPAAKEASSEEQAKTRDSVEALPSPPVAEPPAPGKAKKVPGTLSQGVGSKVPAVAGAVEPEARREADLSVSPQELPPAPPPPPGLSSADRPAEPVSGMAAPAAAPLPAPAPAPAAPRRAAEAKTEEGQASRPAANAFLEATGRAGTARLRSAGARSDSSEASESDEYARTQDRYPESELSAPLPAEGKDDVTRALEAQAADWREFLSRYPEGRFAAAARYRLALCSMRLFELRGSEADRKRAREDATAYLELAPQGESANKIRRGLERLKEK
jgi:hypothetical protein